MCYNISMAWEYIVLDGKKYAVMADGYKPLVQRQRSYDVGLTGKAIIQDFTVESRVPQMWSYRLKVYIDTIEPDRIGYGNIDDFIAAYAKPYFLLTDHFGFSHAVGIPEGYSPQPRVPADLGVQGTYGVFFIDISLIELYGTGLYIPPQVVEQNYLCYLTDSVGNYLTDNRGYRLAVQCQGTRYLTDSQGNTLTDSAGNKLMVV